MSTSTDILGISSKLASARNRPVPGAFTLIELLVTVTILGIVLAVAIPNYRQWVLESGRAEAKAALMEAAQALERCFTRWSSYTGDCAVTFPIDSETGKYQVTATERTQTTFTLSAAPQGGQAEDTECGTYTLRHTGQRGAAGGTDPQIVAKCW